MGWLCLFLTLLCLFLLGYIYNIKKALQKIHDFLKRKEKIETNKLLPAMNIDQGIGKLIILINEDLKKLRKTELALQDKREMYTWALTNFSHDLRTPLTVIKGYVDLSKRETRAKKKNDYLKIIDKKVEELSILTEMLFSYAKEKKEIKKEEICLNVLLEDSLVSFYPLFQKNGLTPNIHLCQEKVFVLGDKQMLTRIFENLFYNMVKYATEKVDISLTKDGLVTFANKAKNINKIQFGKIFQQFLTVNNGMHSENVGLAVVQEFVSLNNGTIDTSFENGIITIKIQLQKKN